MSENNGLDDPGNPHMPARPLGAIHRPAPTHIPMLRAALPLGSIEVPSECRYDLRVSWLDENDQIDALGNDRIGCCVPAATLRLVQLWRNLAGGDRRKPTAERVRGLYTAWAGYNPNDPSTDRGTETDVAFSRFCREGYLWSDQMEIVPRWTVLEADGMAPDLRHVKMGIYALGGVLATIRMPQSALSETTLWLQPQPGTDEARDAGAHEILLCGYDAQGTFYGVSWGYDIAIRPAFLTTRLLQASAFASDAWIDATTGRTPSGLDRDQIRAIGAQIQGV